MQQPLRRTDSQQLIRAHIEAVGGPAAFADRHALNPRTAERIYSGKAACPRGILSEILEGNADG